MRADIRAWNKIIYENIDNSEIFFTTIIRNSHERLMGVTIRHIYETIMTFVFAPQMNHITDPEDNTWRQDITWWYSVLIEKKVTI